jgi:uncharacterized membrane protein YphA (DoxX/SURF4 family)
MKILLHISRILVGTLFFVSGMIKANDPLGFSYKLHDYFAADVLNLPVFDPWALHIAVIVTVIEIVLGLAILAGIKSKLVSWSLLLMIIFFTFLTFYSAYFNKVTDCGCFGDALKFTPWQSFTKDIVLLALILIIFIGKRDIQPNSFKQNVAYYLIGTVLILVFGAFVINWTTPWIWFAVSFLFLIPIMHYLKNETSQWLNLGLLTLLFFGMCYWSIEHLPSRDFRPYAEGLNIREGMQIPEGESAPEYGVVYTMVHKSSGETKEVDSKTYISSGIWEDSNWEITETSDPILLKEGYEPPVHDFIINSDENGDITEWVLDEEKQLLVVMYDLKKAETDNLDKVRSLIGKFKENNIPVYILTASLYETIQNFESEHQLGAEYVSADAIMLKTTVRANPGVIYLEKGTVIKKFHHNDLWGFEDFQFNLGIAS